MSSAAIVWPSPRVNFEHVGRAEAVEVGREAPDHVQDHLLDARRVELEDLEHAHRVDRLGALVDAGVVVGDQADVDDGHAQLAAQVRLRVLGHVDDLPAGVAEPLRLALGREPRALDDHDRALLVDGDVVLADDLDGDPAQLRVVDVGRADVAHDRAVVERVGPAAGPVDELVADHEVARRDRHLEAARRTRADDRLDPERLHRPDVRPEVDPVRRDRVAAAVARQEGDLAPADVGQEQAVGRGP